jgi:hypothetical protein
MTPLFSFCPVQNTGITMIGTRMVLKIAELKPQKSVLDKEKTLDS